MQPYTLTREERMITDERTEMEERVQMDEQTETDARMDLSHPQVGTYLEGIACLAEREQKSTRDGKPYLAVTLRNRTGSIRAKVWSEHLPRWEGVAVGRGVIAAGEIVPGWNGGPAELEIKTVEALPQGHQIERELNAICPSSPESLQARLAALETLIERAGMRRLLRVVLAAAHEQFLISPGAVHHHHNYLHGLLEHSLEVTELALAAARLPRWRERVDTDALILGGLLHDLGKTNEYAWKDAQGRAQPIAVSALGRLVPHVVLGPILTYCAVQRNWEELKQAGVRRIDVEHLIHVQVSHHGTLEWGSPITPCSAEATIIHHCDQVSAKGRSILDVLEQSEANAAGWIMCLPWHRRHPVLDLTRTPALQNEETDRNGRA